VPDSLPYTPALEGRTLLDELNHRIKNELASVINLVTFKAVWTDNVEAKEELSNVVDLLHQHVQVHSILTCRIATHHSWTPANSFESWDWR
jgi:two-component sensor histidine kinase